MSSRSRIRAAGSRAGKATSQLSSEARVQAPSEGLPEVQEEGWPMLEAIQASLFGVGPSDAPDDAKETPLDLEAYDAMLKQATADAATPWLEDEDAQAPTFTYVCTGAETYVSLARQGAGNDGEWRVIEQLNPDVRPEELSAGTVLDLPAEWADSFSEQVAASRAAAAPASAPTTAESAGEQPASEAPSAEQGWLAAGLDLAEGAARASMDWLGGGATTEQGSEEASDGPDPQAQTQPEAGPDAEQMPPADRIYTIANGRIPDENGVLYDYFDARLYDPTSGEAGKRIPLGLKVRIDDAKTLYSDTYKQYRGYVQIVTLPEQEVSFTEEDDAWVRVDHLRAAAGGSVALGDESTQEGAAEADAIREALPEGRSPGESPYTWSLDKGFCMSVDDAVLDPDLWSRVVALMDWAIANDMVTDHIVVNEGVRSPALAHRASTSHQIFLGHISLETLGDPARNGTDDDGTQWYQPGWTLEQVQKNADAIHTQHKPAAEGYVKGDRRRWPNNDRPDISNHLTGQAVDCSIPWRKAGAPASSNKTHTWGWSEVYARFGLDRPVGNESWHIQLAGTSGAMSDAEYLASLGESPPS